MFLSFFLLRGWITFVAGGGGSTIVFPHRHLSWGLAIKERCRWAGVHIQTFFWIMSCLWVRLFVVSGDFCTVSTFFSKSVKCFQFPHGRVACLCRNLSWEGRPLWFLFFLEEWVVRIKHRSRYWVLGENPISSFSAISLFLITDTSPQNTNCISF